jgi:hypothetical protein
MRFDGALMFARFAYPPNELGYCGPDAGTEMLEHTAANAGGGLRELAKSFAGAWPYLELIATANGIGDPLDRRVVEAYWIGNGLLQRVTPALFAESLAGRFYPAIGRSRDRDRLLDPLSAGGLPHHGFHVFGVYPWVGLLRTGLIEQPLLVLDRCRIRWGRVESVSGDEVVVRSRPLLWTNGRLELDLPRDETARVGRNGARLGPPLGAGDWCALHWDWVCQPLSARQLARLRRYTRQQLAAINSVAYPAPAHVLA